MVVWHHVGLAGLWGGLLALERRAFLQAMFSRPLVAATGVGLLMDDAETGLFVGLVLELFYLGAANLGASLPEHDTLAAVSAAGAAAAIADGSGGGGTPAIWSMGILLFVGMGHLGRSIDRGLERYSARLASRAVSSAEVGDLDRAVRQNLFGMWPHFLVFGALSGLSVVAGYLLAPLLGRLPLEAVRGLAWAYPAMASVAAAIAARGAHSRRGAVYAGAAAVVVTGVAVAAYLGGEG
ncbi:MAG: PTS sugar transporter subunit IIC [Myxococcaceae bacterium]